MCGTLLSTLLTHTIVNFYACNAHAVIILHLITALSYDYWNGNAMLTATVLSITLTYSALPCSGETWSQILIARNSLVYHTHTLPVSSLQWNAAIYTHTCIIIELCR